MEQPSSPEDQYFALYPFDFLQSSRIAAFSYEMKGIAIELICRNYAHQWYNHGNGLPDNDYFIANILKITVDEWKRIRPILTDPEMGIVFFHEQAGLVFGSFT